MILVEIFSRRRKASRLRHAAALSGALRNLALVRDEQSAEFRRGNPIPQYYPVARSLEISAVDRRDSLPR